jgi:hypothetical protein
MSENGPLRSEMNCEPVPLDEFELWIELVNAANSGDEIAAAFLLKFEPWVLLRIDSAQSH